MIVKIGSDNIYIDNMEAEGLQEAMKSVDRGSDKFMMIIDGRSGVGKSTKGAQLAYILSKGTLDLHKNYAFTYNRFNELIDNPPDNRVIVLDEAFDIINKRTARTNDNFQMLSKLQKVRLKKLYIIIILLSFYDLDKNVIVSLADLLIHVKRDSVFGRHRIYDAYDPEQMLQLYLARRANMDYPDHFDKKIAGATFNKFFPLDVKEYEELKAQSFEQDEKRDKSSKVMNQRNTLIKYLKDNGTPIAVISELTGLSEIMIYKLMQAMKDE